MARAPSTDYPGCVPVLTDGRIRLRAHTLADVQRVVEMCSDPQTMAWTTVPRPYDAAAATTFIEQVLPAGWGSGADLTWAVEADLTGGPMFKGNVSLRPGAAADLGFDLHPAARGRGLMTAAVRLVARYAFETLSAEAVQWRCEVGNRASWRVAWACGFGWDGEQSRALPRHDGTLVDAWRAVLLPDQPTTGPAAPWFEPPTGARHELPSTPTGHVRR